MNTLQEVFQEYLTTELPQEVGGAVVDHIEMDKNRRRLTVRLRLNGFVAFSPLEQVQNALLEGMRALSIERVELIPRYPADSLSGDAFETVALFLSRRHRVINGTLRDAGAALDGDTLTVSLRHGGLDLLRDNRADQLLSELIEELFARRVTVVFDGMTELSQDDEAYLNAQRQEDEKAAQRIREQAAARAAAAPKAEEKAALPKAIKPADPASRPSDGLPIYLETMQPLFGAPIRERPVPMKDLEADGGQVTVWG
ncbi:MAG: hypothetical protein ACOYJY_03715, partial [Acutalibacteraceae bacterium]